MSIFLNMHQGICAFSKLTLALHNKHTELQNKSFPILQAHPCLKFTHWLFMMPFYKLLEKTSYFPHFVIYLKMAFILYR